MKVEAEFGNIVEDMGFKMSYAHFKFCIVSYVSSAAKTVVGAIYIGAVKLKFYEARIRGAPGGLSIK